MGRMTNALLQPFWPSPNLAPVVSSFYEIYTKKELHAVRAMRLQSNGLATSRELRAKRY